MLQPILVVVLTVFIGSPQQGQEAGQSRVDCRGATGDARVRACTALIDGGTLSGNELGTTYANRALGRMQAGDFQRAVEDWTRALDLRPGDPRLYDGRGLARLQAGDPDGAIADLTQSIEIHPLETAYGNRGMARLRKKEFDLALADLTKAIELNPNNPISWANRGRAKGERLDPSALDDLNKAIELQPDSSNFYSNRGLVKRNLRDLAGALADLDRAIELNPKNLLALNNRGSVRSQLRDLAGADADLTMVIELDPKSATAYGNRALLRQEQGNLRGAMSDVVSGLALNVPEGRTGLLALQGALHRELGNLPAALLSFNEVLELRVTGEYYHLRGLVRMDMGDLESALGDFRAALKLEPTRDYSAIRIWMIESRLGRRAEATEALTKLTPVRRAAGASDWVLALYEFLSGSLPEDRLLRTASAGTEADRIKDRACEAYFYAGWVRLVSGNIPGARQFFQRTIDTGRTRMVEYASARAELSRLK